MQKFNLEMMKLSSNEVLERSQMRDVRGGTSYSCTCTQGVGSWTGDYSTLTEIDDAISRNCEGGNGICKQSVEPG